MVGGRGSDTYADGTIKINPISLCSHTDAHPNLNREVRHSPVWHSSESESALERFEPVAVIQQLPDGQGTVFAPEGDGCLQRAKREDAGRFSKEGKSLDDFWYFWSFKSTIKKKVTFGILRLGDAVQRRLRHPEPSSWSHKSTTRKSIRNKKLLNKKIHATKYSNHPHPQVKKLRLTPQLVSHSSFSFPLQ